MPRIPLDLPVLMLLVRDRRVGAACRDAARTSRPSSTSWHAQDCRRPAPATGGDVRRPWRHYGVPLVWRWVLHPRDGWQMTVAGGDNEYWRRGDVDVEIPRRRSRFVVYFHDRRKLTERLFSSGQNKQIIIRNGINLLEK